MSFKYYFLLLFFSTFSLGSESKNMNQYSKAVSYTKDKEINFPDFTLKYLGSKHYQHPTASISSNTATYIAKGLNDVEVKVEVVSGQLPPKPVDFEIQGKNFTLYTFTAPDGVRLEPSQLIITLNTIKKTNSDKSPHIIKPKK